MFDFEKLNVYAKSREFYLIVKSFCNETVLHRSLEDQLNKAALSISLNIAEGTGRETAKEKRRFYIISRGSVYECAAILDILNKSELISRSQYEDLYEKLDTISKMLYWMMKDAERKMNNKIMQSQ